LNKDIANELKAIRTRLNIRREDAAKDNDLSLETLRRYETDASNISIKKLEQILDYYGVNRYTFFNTICEYNHERSD